MATAKTAPVLADKVPEPGEKPPEPTITIAEVKAPQVIEGPVEVTEFVPSADDLARLAKNTAEAAPGSTFAPTAEVPARSTIIPASVAVRTMAEMEAGRKIVEERTKLRDKLMGLG